MDYIKLAGIVLGSNVILELVKYILHYRTQRKLKRAEIRNLDAQTDEKVAQNWMQWSEKMEERINELEKDNKEMKEKVVMQRKEINELKKYIDQLEEELRTYQKDK